MKGHLPDSRNGCSLGLVLVVLYRTRISIFISILQGPCNILVHTEAQGELEKTLLDKATQEVDRQMQPAIFPLMMIVNICFSAMCTSSNQPFRALNLHTGISLLVTLAVRERVYSGSTKRATLSADVDLAVKHYSKRGMIFPTVSFTTLSNHDK